MTDELLDKLHRMGLINSTKSLQKAEEISASAFCRRRLPVVMVRMKMAQNLKVAVTLIEQGQGESNIDVIHKANGDPVFVCVTLRDIVMIARHPPWIIKLHLWNCEEISNLNYLT